MEFQELSPGIRHACCRPWCRALRCRIRSQQSDSIAEKVHRRALSRTNAHACRLHMSAHVTKHNERNGLLSKTWVLRGGAPMCPPRFASVPALRKTGKINSHAAREYKKAPAPHSRAAGATSNITMFEVFSDSRKVFGERSVG